MNIKKIILVTIGLIVLGFSFFYSYKTFLGPINTRLVKDPIFSIFLENKQKVFQETTDWHEVKITYPEQNTPAAEFIFKQWNDFANEYQLRSIKNRDDAKEKLGLGDMPDQKYVFTADYKLVEGGTLFGTSTITYVYTVYVYTGGAHGGTYISAYTVDEFGKIYKPEDFIPDEKLTKVSAYVATEIQKQRKEKLAVNNSSLPTSEAEGLLKDDSWIKEGTAPTRENYSVVWPEGNNFVVSFGQYQVASYAEGMFQVEVPKKMLE